MFRITAQYDDPWHPLQGDVVTVATANEARAHMRDASHEDGGDLSEIDLDGLTSQGGGYLTCYGDGVEYRVERV